MTVARAAPTSAMRGKKTKKASRAKHSDGKYDLRRRERARKLRDAERRVGHQGQRERGSHDAEQREARQLARDDQRTQRVTERDERDLRDGADVTRADVQPHESGDADEPESQSGDAPRVEVIVTARRPRQDRADRRHKRDEQSGERARDPTLGIGQQEPRGSDLDDGINEDPLPVGKQWPQVVPRGRDG